MYFLSSNVIQLYYYARWFWLNASKYICIIWYFMSNGGNAKLRCRKKKWLEKIQLLPPSAHIWLLIFSPSLSHLCRRYINIKLYIGRYSYVTVYLVGQSRSLGSLWRSGDIIIIIILRLHVPVVPTSWYLRMRRNTN